DRLEFFERLGSHLAGVPGVTQVAFGNRLPLRGNWISGMIVDPVDAPAAADPVFQQAGFQAVSPAYFATVGIPVRRVRATTRADAAGSGAIAVWTETFSRMLLDGGDPLGRRTRRGPGMPAITIVGAVADLRRTGRADAEGRRPADVIPQVYLAA